MIILAIETSCDETSVAVVEDGKKLHSLVVNSQIDIHAAYGGVIPEIAARSHIEVMIPVVEQALGEAFGPLDKRHMTEDIGKDSTVQHPTSSVRDHWSQIDAIAVTQGPGLLGSLLIGVLTARTLAWAKKKPLYPVHHILGHVYANWIIEETRFNNEQLAKDDALTISKVAIDDNNNLPIANSSNIVHRKLLNLPKIQPEFPVLALIVSGGHTQLMYGQSHEDWRVIGRTQDDAVGEAFDKVAKVLGLPYPGGPSVAKAAENGDSTKYQLPTPKVDSIDPGLAALRSEIEERGSKTLRPSPARHPELVSGSTTAETQILKQVQDDKAEVLQSSVSSPRFSTLNFSFSGLKTAVLRAVQKDCGKTHEFPSFELAALLSDSQKADFAASFQAKAIDYLVSKTKAAFDEFQPKTVIIGGGVAASLPLREALSDQIPIEIKYAPQILCTDNAAMIGARAYYQTLYEEPVDPRSLEVKPSWPL